MMLPSIFRTFNNYLWNRYQALVDSLGDRTKRGFIPYPPLLVKACCLQHLMSAIRAERVSAARHARVQVWNHWACPICLFLKSNDRINLAVMNMSDSHRPQASTYRQRSGQRRPEPMLLDAEISEQAL